MEELEGFFLLEKLSLNSIVWLSLTFSEDLIHT